LPGAVGEQSGLESGVSLSDRKASSAVSPAVVQVAAQVNQDYNTKIVSVRAFYEQNDKAVYRVERAGGRPWVVRHFPASRIKTPAADRAPPSIDEPRAAPRSPTSTNRTQRGLSDSDSTRPATPA
jgi:hypothetical protein